MQLEHSFTVPVPIAHAWEVLLDIEQIAPCMPGAVLDSIDGDDFTGRVKVKLGPISLTYKGKASFVKKDEATHTAVIDAAGKDQRGNGTAAATVTATLRDQDGASTLVEVLTDLNITGRPAQFGRGVMVDVGNKLIGQFAACVEGKLREAGASADNTVSAASTAAEETASEETPRGRHAAEAAAAAAEAEGGSAEAEAPKVSAAERGDRGASTVPKPASDRPSPKSGSGVASTTAAKPRAVPAREPEPIDLLEVAGGSVITRIGIPAAGLAAAVGILVYIVRKIRA